MIDPERAPAPGPRAARPPGGARGSRARGALDTMSRRSRLDLPSWPWERQDDAAHAQATFLRGLSIGALIGAAIAGSAIWERRRIRGRADETTPDRPPDPRPEPRTAAATE